MFAWGDTEVLKLFAFGRMLAELHSSIHQCRVDHLPSQHEQLERLIARAELPADRRDVALARLGENITAERDQLIALIDQVAEAKVGKRP